MEVNGPYSDCVAFIDILGFKEMSKDYDKILQNAEAINNAIDVMKNFKPKQIQIFEGSNINVLQVSDSLVFLFSKDFISVIAAFQWIAILQFLLAKTGIYVRGSINAGAMYINTIQDRYFGEAWNNAVIAEGNAINPRILVEPRLANFAKEELCKIKEGVLEFYLDDNGSYVLSSYSFVTAINAVGSKESETAYAQMLNKLLINIESEKHNKQILRKYLWIIRQIEREKNAKFANKIEEVKQLLITYLTQN